MNNTKVYKDDVGTVIELDTGVDLSDAYKVAIAVRKPDGTEEEWSASVNAQQPTRLYHVAAEGDLDQVGEYYVQASVTMPAWSGRGQTTSFFVYDRFS